jgi:hypothetical protein
LESGFSKPTGPGHWSTLKSDKIPKSRILRLSRARYHLVTSLWSEKLKRRVLFTQHKSGWWRAGTPALLTLHYFRSLKLGCDLERQWRPRFPLPTKGSFRRNTFISADFLDKFAVKG